MSDRLAVANRQIARGAGVVMAGMALSSLAGLASTMLVSRAFGTSRDLDAFYAANRLTEILFNLMAGGALASAFVPTFTGFLTRGDRPGGWRLAASVTNLVFLGLTTVSAAAALAGPWLVRHVLAPGFDDPAQISLTVSLLRIMLLSSIVFGLSGLLMGILNAHQHFALPALAPACYRAGWIIGVVLFVPRWGIHGLAWGVVLGACLHLLIQLPALRGRGAVYKPGLNLGDPDVRLVGKLMAPRLLGVAVVQLNFLVNTILASGMAEGSLAAITFGFTLMIMPQAVIAQATAIAALPTFSEQAARSDPQALRATLSSALRAVLFLSLPASIGLILLRRPIVQLLLERGAFGAESTEMVAWALLWYAAGLVGHSLLEVLVRAYYAMQDTRTPVLVGASAMTLNVALSLGLTALFPRVGWAPHGGLALANSLATAMEFLILLRVLQRRLPGRAILPLDRPVVATVAAAGILAAGLWGWLTVARGWPAWLAGGGGVVLGLAVYWAAAVIFGSPLARQLPELVLRRRRA